MKNKIDEACRGCSHANKERISCDNPKVYPEGMFGQGLRLAIYPRPQYHSCRWKEITLESIEAK